MFSYNLILSGLMLSLVCSVGVVVLLVLIYFVTLRLARKPPTWEMTAQMVLADDVFWVLTKFLFCLFPQCVLG